jgi:hypothetical protein
VLQQRFEDISEVNKNYPLQGFAQVVKAFKSEDPDLLTLILHLLKHRLSKITYQGLRHLLLVLAHYHTGDQRQSEHTSSFL